MILDFVFGDIYFCYMFTVPFQWSCTTSLPLYGGGNSTHSLASSSLFMASCSVSQLAFLWLWPTFSCPQKTTAGGGVLSSVQGMYLSVYIAMCIEWGGVRMGISGGNCRESGEKRTSFKILLLLCIFQTAALAVQSFNKTFEEFIFFACVHTHP